MGFATFSYDVAPDAASRAAIVAAVDQQLAPFTWWQLLAELWMIEFPSIADFETFGSALEALYARYRGEFDYFALHFDPGGGPVEIAPNPAVRQPAPVAGARGAAPAAAGVVQRATLAVADPRPVLSQLEGLHATSERERSRRRRAASHRKTGDRGGKRGPRRIRARGPGRIPSREGGGAASGKRTGKRRR